MAKLTPGGRLRSVACATEVIVVVAPTEEVALTCGGHPMTVVAPGSTADRTATATLDPALASGTLLGKRYAADGERRLELLCTKAGDGTLAIGGSPLKIKDSKALPSSD